MQTMNAAQCSGVMVISASIGGKSSESRATRPGTEKRNARINWIEPGHIHDTALRLGGHRFHRYLRAGLRALPLVPPEHEAAGNVDTGVGANQDTDKECEREIIDRAATEDEQ